MLRSEAENMVRRAIEDTLADYTPEQIAAMGPAGTLFTDVQITAMASMVTRITGRMIEEAFSSWRPGVPGSKPTFFTD
jgi:hypothetical protein